MKPYAVRKMMLVIATFVCLLGGMWVFHATAPHDAGAKATQPKASPMVLVYDTTKSAGTTITLPIIGRAGERIGKANFTEKDVFTSQNHGLKNGQEIWVSGTGDTTNSYRVTNAQKNTFSLMEMSTGIDGTGFDPGIKILPDAEGRFAFGGDGYSWGWSGRKWDKIGLHKAVLPDVMIQ